MIDSSEIWKVINLDGIKTHYMVSNKGRVMNTKSKLIIKPFKTIKRHTTKDDDFYLSVRLYFPGKSRKQATVPVHRLVALYFIPNPNNFPMVNHIDGNKSNNDVSNLEWCTASENTLHAFVNKLEVPIKGEDHYNHILTEKDVHEICKGLINGIRPSDLAKMYGVTKTTINDIRVGKSWKDITSQYVLPKPKVFTKDWAPYYDELDKMICSGLRPKDIRAKLQIPGITKQQYILLIADRKKSLRKRNLL